MALTPEERKYVLELRSVSKDYFGRVSPSIAARIFAEEKGFYLTNGSIRRIWKEEGLKLQYPGGARNFTGTKRINPLTNSSQDKYFDYVNRAKFNHR
ncbi:MAG: hypothetical protein WC584_05185 [Candidatus Pacearchaeota archaeon]